MATRICAECGGPLPPPAPTGRPRVYCTPLCRSRAAHARARPAAVFTPQPAPSDPARFGEWMAGFGWQPSPADHGEAVAARLTRL